MTTKPHGKNFNRGFDFFTSYQDRELALRIAEDALSGVDKANAIAKRLGVPVQDVMGLTERLYRWIWED